MSTCRVWEEITGSTPLDDRPHQQTGREDCFIEGTTQEILEIFPSSYRATPNPNTPNGNSPVEALMNHKVRLYMDIIHPIPKHSPKRNMMMEKQFNQHHVAMKHAYVPGQSILVKYYHNGKENWIQGCILCCSGNATYAVDIESTVWIRYETNYDLLTFQRPNTTSPYR